MISTMITFALIVIASFTVGSAVYECTCTCCSGNFCTPTIAGNSVASSCGSCTNTECGTLYSSCYQPSTGGPGTVEATCSTIAASSTAGSSSNIQVALYSDVSCQDSYLQFAVSNNQCFSSASYQQSLTVTTSGSNYQLNVWDNLLCSGTSSGAVNGAAKQCVALSSTSGSVIVSWNSAFNKARDASFISAICIFMTLTIMMFISIY